VRAVVQRVAWARVSVAGELVGALERPGLVVFVGVARSDGESEAVALASKLWRLRIMDDAEGKMNLSLADVGGGLLVISQFTLLADASKGRRPSFVAAAPSEIAEPLVAHVVEHLRGLGAEVSTGRFGADMLVELANDGPVTLVIDTALEHEMNS
jgi:D-tyrosyl-tRNA(Tyr) deacylase